MPRRRIDKPLLFTSLGIAAGLVLIVWGFSAGITGRDALRLPDAIESMDPSDGDRVLRQAEILVDLAEGYEGELVIDGIELPTVRLGELDGTDGAQPGAGEQVVLPPVAVFDPATGRLRFRPVDGAPIESFAQGMHTASVVYWSAEEGRDRARTYRWSFVVS